jgi:hypothetical protein
MNPVTKQQGPDPAVQEAINRLGQTQLSPLEEVMYNSWASANGLDPESNDMSVDLRGVYQQTNGKVMPPGMLKNQAQRATDMNTLQQAQEAHDATSPRKLAESQGVPFPANPITGPTPGQMPDPMSQQTDSGGGVAGGDLESVMMGREGF